MSDLEKDLAEVRAALDEPIPEPKPQPVKRRIKMAKKVKKSAEETAPKATKKVSNKANGASKPAKESDPNVVTIAQLAEEAGIGAQSARVKLREAQAERPSGRWEWAVGSKALKDARKTLGLSA